MQEYRIAYEVDLDERHELVRTMFDIPCVERMVREARKKILIAGAVFFVAALVSAGVVLRLMGESLMSPGFVVIGVIMLVWAFGFVLRHFTQTGMGRHLSGLLADTARAQGGPGVQGQVYMELRDDTLVLGDRDSVSRMRWPCFKRIVTRPTCTLCELSNGSWATVPKSAFGHDEHAYRRFVDRLERLNEDAGGWDGIVARHLREFRCSCPSCRYDLHMAAGAQCPECGHRLEAKDFRFEQVERVAEPLGVNAMSSAIGEL
ncbi:MAG: hypothetical protein ACF8LL_01145 [Phycisphaerales bacterium]